MPRDAGARRIDAWMPAFDVAAYHERAVAAPAERVYAALRHADLAADPLVRLLFTFRGLGRSRPRRTHALDDFVADGFTLLEEIAGTEIVLGLTGRFWRPSGALVRLTPQQFAAFARPGWGQAVWSFHVAPARAGAIVSTETRVRATDEASRRAFRRYWRVVGPFSALIRRRVLALVAARATRPAR
jgi:hypothetical protein